MIIVGIRTMTTLLATVNLVCGQLVAGATHDSQLPKGLRQQQPHQDQGFQVPPSTRQ